MNIEILKGNYQGSRLENKKYIYISVNLPDTAM